MRRIDAYVRKHVVLAMLVVFALTVDGMVPAVFATPAPLAFHAHATYVALS